MSYFRLSLDPKSALGALLAIGACWIAPTAMAASEPRTWLYSAQFDQVVPARNALALGRAAGLEGEHHQWLPAGHYTAAAFLPVVMHRMLDQFRAPVAAK